MIKLYPPPPPLFVCKVKGGGIEKILIWICIKNTYISDVSVYYNNIESMVEGGLAWLISLVQFGRNKMESFKNLI